jgi:hypothetical protein
MEALLLIEEGIDSNRQVFLLHFPLIAQSLKRALILWRLLGGTVVHTVSGDLSRSAFLT